jgi:hypothetical protein
LVPPLIFFTTKFSRGATPPTPPLGIPGSESYCISLSKYNFFLNVCSHAILCYSKYGVCLI